MKLSVFDYFPVDIVPDDVTILGMTFNGWQLIRQVEGCWSLGPLQRGQPIEVCAIDKKGHDRPDVFIGAKPTNEELERWMSALGLRWSNNDTVSTLERHGQCQVWAQVENTVGSLPIGYGWYVRVDSSYGEDVDTGKDTDEKGREAANRAIMAYIKSLYQEGGTL